MDLVVGGEGVAWSRKIYFGGGLATYFRVIGDWWRVNELLCTWQTGERIYLQVDWTLNLTCCCLVIIVLL